MIVSVIQDSIHPCERTLTGEGNQLINLLEAVVEDGLDQYTRL
jgi:hypothetical protein